MDSEKNEKDVKMYKEFFNQTKNRNVAGIFDLNINKTDFCCINDVGYVYNQENSLHFKKTNDSIEHVESPLRVETALVGLIETGCIEKMKQIPSREITEEELSLIHSNDYIKFLNSLSKMTTEECEKYEQSCDSIYINQESGKCARLAAGSTINLSLSVFSGLVKSGVALVRPPGHHAESGCSKGFCILNNMALSVAALKEKGAKKILVVDWDIHHGNGTQDAFYNDSNVLVISIHRYDNGTFYPSSEKGDACFVGGIDALGKNINIPWNKKKKTDNDYLYAFEKIVLPVANEFVPDIILISAGFDGAFNDPLGGCYITPNGFALMTYLLLSVSEKVVLILEGGYTPETVSNCLIECVFTLFGKPPEYPRKREKVSKETIETISRVIYYHKEFWECLSSFPFESPIKGELAGSISLDALIDKKLTELLLETGLIEQTSSASSTIRIFLSKNIEENKKIIVMAHEKFFSSFKYNWKTVCPHNSKLSFPVVECIKKAINSGFGVLLFLFPNQTWSVLKQPKLKRIDSSEITKTIDTVFKAVCTEEKKIGFFAGGIGVMAISKFLFHRNIKEVLVISFFSQTLLLPFIKENWYLEKSVNFIPSNLLRGEKVPLQSGFGNCFSIGKIFMKQGEDEMILSCEEMITIFNKKLVSN